MYLRIGTKAHKGNLGLIDTVAGEIARFVHLIRLEIALIVVTDPIIDPMTDPMTDPMIDHMIDLTGEVGHMTDQGVDHNIGQITITKILGHTDQGGTLGKIGPDRMVNTEVKMGTLDVVMAIVSNMAASQGLIAEGDTTGKIGLPNRTMIIQVVMVLLVTMSKVACLLHLSTQVLILLVTCQTSMV